MRFVVDEPKAEALLGKLLGALERKEYPYDQPGVEPPQVMGNMPRNLVMGTRQHANFLFTINYHMRGGIQSDTATRAQARMFEGNPELFVPEKASRANPRFVRKLLTANGLGFQRKAIAGYWVENARRLAERWGGHPGNIFDGVSDYEEACRRIQNDHRGGGFLGFQEKMVSMLTYFLMDAGFIDSFRFPIPVDFHVLRFVMEHEIVVVEDPPADGNLLYKEKLLEVVRGLFLDYANRHHVDPLQLTDVVWLLSRSLCSQHPGNQTRAGKRSGRATELTPVAVTWNASQTEAYLRSCAACPVESTCLWNVPSAYYYIRGAIVLQRERQKPPLLFFEPIYNLRPARREIRPSQQHEAGTQIELFASPD